MNGLLKIRMNVRRQDTKLVSTITSVVLLIVSLFSYDFENCIKRTKSLFGQLMRIALRELNLFENCIKGTKSLFGQLMELFKGENLPYKINLIFVENNKNINRHVANSHWV